MEGSWKIGFRILEKLTYQNVRLGCSMALNASHVRDKMNSNEKKIFDFCSIQIQIIKEKEEKLRKEILDCKIQQEFLKSIISDITGEKRNV